MRGPQRQGAHQASQSHTYETLTSWGRIQTRRRHHFANERSNHSYLAEPDPVHCNQDVQHYGDVPTSINTNTTFRVIGGNIKGVKPSGTPEKIETVSERLKHLQVGHIALQETNSEWNKGALREAHTAFYKQQFKTATFQYGTSKDNFESNYKPGGTASGALGVWVHRVVGRDRDPTGCGRWTSLTYGGKAQRRLTIITVYRVGNDARLGQITARKQQHAVMYQDQELRPFMIDPHRQTMIDLQYHVEELLSKGHEVLLAIDANQSESKNYRQQDHSNKFKTVQGFHIDGSLNGSLSEFIRNTGLTNLTTYKHDGVVPHTFIRGKGQIDFLFGSMGVIDSIEATGILNKSTLDSDHCPLFVDLNIEKLFGINEESAALTAFTSIRLDDPRVSVLYRKELHAQFTHHGIYKKIKALQDNIKSATWDMVDEMIYESTDKAIGEAMQRAATCCTSTKKKHPWTKSISQASHLIRYWSARITRKGERSIDDPVLNYYLHNAGDLVGLDDRVMTTDECIQHGIGARHRLKDVLKEAKSKSQSYMEEVAAALVERRFPHLTEDNEECAHEREDRILMELKNMGNRKSKKRMFRKLARQIKEEVKPNSTVRESLNHVLIPSDGNIDLWERITGKESLEQHLIERNIKQFSAAGETPFGYSELGRELGHNGNSKMATDILNGELEHPALQDEAIREIVKQLKAHPAIRKILEPVVTLEDFKEAVRLVPEKTASSYSGRGVPHYKACAEKTSDPLADVLAAVHAAMMSMPLATGYCPTRWKHVIDVMLAKIPGISRTDKLRIIQLLEADLNQVLRIAFARNIARLAEENHGIISEHQYGKANSSCMTPVINKLLTIQLLIQKKTEGVIFDNDAKGCYDRIINGISLATLRRIGFSKNSVKLLGTLWEQLQHHVATGYGVSEVTYKSTAEKLLYGIGQGSCASPILWALLNQLLMAALGEKFECLILHSADKKTTSKRPGDSFVDDTTNGVTNDDCNLPAISFLITCLTETEDDMVKLMEEIIQFFLDILQVTGGDLSFPKCVWFLICFRWRNGRARLLKVSDEHRGINLTSKSTNQRSGIKRKGPTESHTTLGFKIMGNGECTAQAQHMTQKAKIYGTAIKESSIWKGEAAAAYNSLYLPSVGYGTAATTLSTTACEIIQRPVVNAILPKMGIARSAPRAVVFGTSQYGGMGLAHLAALQGHSRLQYLIGHLRQNDTTGKLIRTMLEYTKIECGCNGNPLMLDYDKYGRGLLSQNWITDVWRHLTETGAQIDLPGLWNPTHGRENDSVLMEFAYNCEDMTAKELQDINRCRMYMRVHFVSDVATLEGEELSNEAIRGRRTSDSESTWSWPVQQRPIRWGAWRKLLSLVSMEGRLDQAVGSFYTNGHRQFTQVYNQHTKELMIKTNDSWTTHKRIYGREKFEIDGVQTGIPRDYTHVVQTTARRSYLEITGKNTVSANEQVGGTQENYWDENCEQLPPQAQRMMGSVTQYRETPEHVLLATDGSVLFGVGYHSWIMANAEGEPCSEGGGPDDGDLLLMTSFRSELGGIAAGLAAIGSQVRNGSTIKTVKVLCDNQSALKRCKRGMTKSIFTSTEGDYDLTSTIDWIQKVWCKGIAITYEWVKGHADDLDRITTLQEELNIMADAKCNEIRQQARGNTIAKRQCDTWTTEVCSLLIKGVKITSHWKERLTQQLLDGKLREHLMVKEKWSDEDFEDVCWHEQEVAMKRLSTTRRTAIAKVCHNLCFTGKRAHAWYGDDSECKLCNCPNEDWRHVITCNSISAELQRADSWNKVKKVMSKWKMPNDMWLAMENGIRHYIQHPENRHEQTIVPEMPFHETTNRQRGLLRTAFRKQTQLGWENFMKGRLSMAWTSAMLQHYETNQIKLNVKEWTTKLILALWDHMQRTWKFRNDTVHKLSSTTIKQYKIDELTRKIKSVNEEYRNNRERMTHEQMEHFEIDMTKLQYESKRCWVNIAELYIKEVINRCDENEALTEFLMERNGMG